MATLDQNDVSKEKSIKVSKDKNSVKIHPAFIQSVDFKELTQDWLDSRQLNCDFKILRIKNCLDFAACSKHLVWDMSLATMNNLFVLLLEFSENFDEPTESELRKFWRVFRDDRPVILQLTFDKQVKHIFVKNFKGSRFYNLAKVATTEDSAIKDLKKLMENHGRFDGDFEKAKLTEIPEKSKWFVIVPESVLLMRFINLFSGGCTFLTPWLNADIVLKSKSLKNYLAFIDFPFKAFRAVQLAWNFQRYDLVEFFVANHSHFPTDFDVTRMTTKISDDFKKILNEREKLHDSIKKGDKDEVLRVLNEMEKRGRIKHAFDASNISAMATLLKNFNLEIYEILVEKNLRFCMNCEQLMNELSLNDRKAVRKTNKKLARPMKCWKNEHLLLSKCFLATGHHDYDFYCEKINEQLWKLQKIPEIALLLRIQECKVVDEFTSFCFDFKHNSKGLRAISCERLETDFPIYISAKRDDKEIRFLFIEQITRYVMKLLYKNHGKPYCVSDSRREREFNEAAAEFREVRFSEQKMVTQTFDGFFESFAEEFVAIRLMTMLPQIFIDHTENEIEEIKAKHPKLFAYCYKYLPADMEAFLARTRKVIEDLKASEIELLRAQENFERALKKSKF